MKIKKGAALCLNGRPIRQFHERNAGWIVLKFVAFGNFNDLCSDLDQLVSHFLVMRAFGRAQSLRVAVEFTLLYGLVPSRFSMLSVLVPAQVQGR